MALIVKLNGSNYVSDKTRAAFAQALAAGRVSEKAGERVSELANERLNEPATTNYGLRTTVQNPKSRIENPVTQYAVRSTPANLDLGLTRAYEQQQTTARVHEQYLAYQAEYANLYAQLLQQQGAIFGGVNGDSRKAELAAQVLETLAQSMARFHELQSQTLNVHKQFLGQQADTSHAYMQLMANSEWRMAGEQISQSQIANQPMLNEQVGKSANERESESASQRINESASQRASESAAPIQNPKSKIENPVTQYAVRNTETTRAETPTSTISASALQDTLLRIVSDKTGYPAEMLEPEMDMEADLGIDSIKRVEIMAALREAYPALPKTDPAVFAELRTLGQITEYASQRIGEKATTDYALRTSDSKKA